MSALMLSAENGVQHVPSRRCELSGATTAYRGVWRDRGGLLPSVNSFE
jgi:hypothetical protein